MKREEIIDAIINAAPNLKKNEARKVYNAIIQNMFQSLVEGETVRLSGIGALSVTTRKATTYRNPQTKELIKKPSHKRIKLSMSKNIKEVLNAE